MVTQNRSLSKSLEQTETDSLFQNAISSPLPKEFLTRTELIEKLKNFGVLFYPFVSTFHSLDKTMPGCPKILDGHQLDYFVTRFCKSEKSGIKNEHVVQKFKELACQLKDLQEFFRSQRQLGEIGWFDSKCYMALTNRLLKKVATITGDVEQIAAKNRPSFGKKHKIVSSEFTERIKTLNKILNGEDFLKTTVQYRKFKWSRFKVCDVEIRKTSFDDSVFRIKTDFLASKRGDNHIAVDKKGNITKFWLGDMVKTTAYDDEILLGFQRNTPFSQGKEMGSVGNILHTHMVNAILDSLLKKLTAPQQQTF